jgi:hypothetical protein
VRIDRVRGALQAVADREQLLKAPAEIVERTECLPDVATSQSGIGAQCKAQGFGGDELKRARGEGVHRARCQDRRQIEATSNDLEIINDVSVGRPERVVAHRALLERREHKIHLTCSNRYDQRVLRVQVAAQHACFTDRIHSHVVSYDDVQVQI